MFTTNLAQFKTQQEELHRRAAHYRLVKSLETPRDSSNWLISLVISLMGHFGPRVGSFAQIAR